MPFDGRAGNNGTGVTGVAWKVQIMALKFIGQRGGSTSAAVACLDYARDLAEFEAVTP